MSYIGFQVTFKDGRKFRECDGYWDEVPNDGIVRLELLRDWSEVLASLEGANDRKFFFYNECVTLRGGSGILAAKGIGFIDSNGKFKEVRIEANQDETNLALQNKELPSLTRINVLEGYGKEVPEFNLRVGSFS